ncbi:MULTISPECIES: extracellular solute-binding protein [unclassified Cryobacterium]|uniref:extracellular solute-binding protein n=1 Tax=unclassified Cryobacterium TaxID=2649013 RepID=UPI002AC9BAED|nr:MULTISPECIES: extracellular solute-binding protein [Cryobacterium]MEB0001670.1 extracellular solute-binding protein [Cryobacterium sp. RTC2.1]MEB0286701.1 extracellular solute-binding protein [Cryobacterium sp. 10S3]MEB0303875.1 extracellular solute-binding protein [Cryobacterium sp. 10I1]MEC5148735.1 multiple sugar transport system substrate-binding protein [Cryobacterium psychrotolerans]WPX13178.1 extracellular solute-binding protein [Cryobacterium sp. 10S3]
MSRSRTKWILPLAAGVAASVLALSACSSGASGSASGVPSDKPLTVWVMGDSSKKFETLVEPFTKSTGIKVDAVAIPWDSIDQKLTTAVASGNGPDVVQIGVSKIRSFADTGGLLTLDQATIANYPNLAADKFVAGASGEATAVAGKVVSIPWVSDTRVLFYRSDILSASGISKPPTTWDELRGDAKTLTARGAGNYGYYIPQWDSALPVEMTWDQGGDVVDKTGNIDFNTPAFHKAVDVYAGLYADGSVPTNSDFDQVQGFTSGATPMVVSGPYLASAITAAAPELAGKWSAVPLPSAKAGTSLLAGSNLGVFAKTANKDGALQLLNYLSDTATQVSWYKADGDLPTVKTALTDDSLVSDPLFNVYAKQLADSKLLPLVSNWDGVTGKALLDSLNSIVLNHADRDSTLNTLYASTAGQSVK